MALLKIAMEIWIRERAKTYLFWIFFICLSASPLTSTVVSQDHPGLSYSLSLIRSEPTFAQPDQLWQFVSDSAVSQNAILCGFGRWYVAPHTLVCLFPQTLHDELPDSVEMLRGSAIAYPNNKGLHVECFLGGWTPSVWTNLNVLYQNCSGSASKKW